MSKALKIVAIGLLSASSLWAQEFIVSEEERREFVPTEPAPLRPSIEGIVKDVFTKKPWQLVNPAAPPEYGSGQKSCLQGLRSGYALSFDRSCDRQRGVVSFPRARGFAGWRG